MRLFIRTEASSLIGMGHFMRCFAIAEAAGTRGVEVTFLLNEISEAVAARLAAIGAKGVIVAGPLGFEGDFMALAGLNLTRQDWLIVDSYQADEAFIRTLSNGTQVAVIDDMAALERYDCDLIINPAEAAHDFNYRRKSDAKLLLGADYALIRSEFREAQTKTLAQPTIAIMFGGSDPAGLTGQCAQLIQAVLPDVTIRLIAGPANRRLDELKAMASERIEVHASPDSVADVLAGCDLVITAAGGSVGEVAALALPALVLVVYDNQVAALKACPYPVIDARNGLPADLGDRVKALMADPQARATIAKSAHALVDGWGPARIVEVLFGV